MKLYIFIRDQEDFLAGKMDFALTIRTDRDYTERLFPEYTYAGEVEVEIDVDEQVVRQKATELLDEKINHARAMAQKEIESLETRKQNLLALTHEVAE